MKKFNVVYWVHLSNSFVVEANNEDEAEQKVRDMVEKGEITCKNLEFGDDGYECFNHEDEE